MALIKKCEYIECMVCEPVKMKKCAGCRSVSYCSIECQRLDWPYHKTKCGEVSITCDKFRKIRKNLKVNWACGEYSLSEVCYYFAKFHMIENKVTKSALILDRDNKSITYVDYEEFIKKTSNADMYKNFNDHGMDIILIHDLKLNIVDLTLNKLQRDVTLSRRYIPPIKINYE
jgi:hypothetical protein